MKTIKNILILAVCIAAASCTKRDIKPEAGNAKDCLMTIRLDSAPPEFSKAQSASEAAVNKLTVCIYDADGKLEWDGYWDKNCPSEIDVTGIEAGQKTICAAANKIPESKKTPDNFKGNATRLEDNSSSNFVMYAAGSATASKEGGDCQLSLQRIAAKIEIVGNIRTAFSEKMVKPDFDITQIYVGNAGAVSDFSGKSAGISQLVNDCSYQTTTSESQLRTLTVADKISWTDGGKFNGGVHFYCYPNTLASKGTRLLLKAKYNSDICYYPIDIPECLANHCYSVGDIVITAKGADSPDGKFSKSSISFIVSVTDWSGISLGNKEF